MLQKPSIPKGTRDFSPNEMSKRNYVFNTIRKIYELHGFCQIETPALENLSTLLGKYGDEGDRLLFKVLNNGNYLDGIKEEELYGENALHLSSKICSRGLRYDLTVPFARYIVMHKESLTLPFKRYQIQPVWRADRPQKGRYREFYQCDADVVGSTSLLNEVEFVQMFDEVFKQFGIRVQIRLNSRKVLFGIAEVLKASSKFSEMTTIIDKLDKIGIEVVEEELRNIGISEDAIGVFRPLLCMEEDNEGKLSAMSKVLSDSLMGQEGLSEIRHILETLKSLGLTNEVFFDITLARGLNYYTGTIFEVRAKDVSIGSIAGGGRYDNLTGIFGVSGLSGAGISFGADRICDVLNELELFPETMNTRTKLLFINFGDAQMAWCLSLATKTRNAGISTEIYPEPCKMKKQMAYANAKGIPFVAFIGDEEVANGTLSLKDMATGEQKILTPNSLIDFLNNA